jgi:hypothetical protein
MLIMVMTPAGFRPIVKDELQEKYCEGHPIHPISICCTACHVFNRKAWSPHITNTPCLHTPSIDCESLMQRRWMMVFEKGKAENIKKIVGFIFHPKAGYLHFRLLFFTCVTFRMGVFTHWISGTQVFHPLDMGSMKRK